MAAETMRRRAVLAAALGPWLLPGPAAAQERRVRETVDAAMRPLMAAHDVPGMAVGLSLGGVRHVFHYGVTAHGGADPVSADTLFEIGSLSKAFTATLATYAQALGKLSLRDAPTRSVTALRGTAFERTRLLHLGTYTAGGLPLQFPDDVADLASAMAFYRAWTPDAAPGVQRRYSNPSIGLLGHATALAMGGEFGALAERELFARLGLRNTFIRVPAAMQPAYAWGTSRDNQRIRVNPGVFDAEAYGVKSSVGDMLRFIEANIDPAGLEPALRRAVLDTQAPHFRVGPMVQGLGWEQYPFPVPLQQLQAGNAAAMALQPQAAQASPAAAAAQGATLFNKTGSTNGFGAYAAFVPARRVGLVMLVNRNVPNAVRIAAAYAVLEQLG